MTGPLTSWKGELLRKFSKFGGGPKHGGLLEEGKIISLLSLVTLFGDSTGSRTAKPALELSLAPYLHHPSGWDEGASFSLLKTSLLQVSQAALLPRPPSLACKGSVIKDTRTALRRATPPMKVMKNHKNKQTRTLCKLLEGFFCGRGAEMRLLDKDLDPGSVTFSLL